MPSRGTPRAAFLEMLNKSVITRATTEMLQRQPKTQHTPAEHRGLTANKISVIEQLAYMNKSFNIVLQETHCRQASVSQLLTSWVNPEQEPRLATFVHERSEWSLVGQSPEQSETEWLCVDVTGYKMINVCKPPLLRLTPTAIPTFEHPSLYVGDFNCQHVNRNYNETSSHGESLDSWAASNNLGMLENPKETASFLSRRWNVGANPDLAFVCFGQDSRLPDSSKKVPAVATSALLHNATKTQGSCPQRSGGALELSQGWLEALLSYHR